MTDANETGASLTAAQRLLSEVLLASSTSPSRPTSRHKRRKPNPSTSKDGGVPSSSSAQGDFVTSIDEENAASRLQSDLHRVAKNTTLVLTNPARPRPLPPANSTMGTQLRKRDRRVEGRAKKEDRMGRMGKGKDAELGGKGGEEEQGEGEGREGRATTALSRKTKKRLGFLDKHPNLSHSTLEPLSSMWTSYVQQILGWRNEAGQVNTATVQALFQRVDETSGVPSGSLRESAMSGIQSTLSKVDLTGASVRVIRCSDPARVGLKGLVARETENTFVIAVEPAPQTTPTQALPTEGESDEALRQRRSVRPLAKRTSQSGKSGETRVIPKHNAVFEVLVPIPPTAPTKATDTGRAGDAERTLAVPLYGNQMSQGFPTRASKKHKARKSVDF
ncbi:unnamed protein product [Tilletia controversa]|uniref:Uncharacterized protein n=1 Tax=Tilletia controversa TaxID=13291 RepID=A0A8X7MTF1_9BASI|nr:hypothetical protein CF328_g3394 [Tilletia controversa]KAE8247869.1 hypothetical protein A4X06_0g4129 [Tilletia controversa]CAD6927057.1 unnamed protein product [Tilletia controversa]CAD6955853.1 unnamed protein product [Tilletia controversa]CAD6970018.1 unnamed protein product [Tilletia controversa]